MPLGKISAMLGISKGSVSMGTRQLATWGAIRKVWIPGDRRDYYEATENLKQLIHTNFNNLIKPKIGFTKKRLDMLKVNLAEDLKSGKISSNKKEILEKRINELQQIQSFLSKLIPIVRKIIR